ncbi:MULTISPECIES: hypothetical protein [Methylotenera]|uniref:hypothetical protein n=1 Tax=Methylotenera TaxID=359407 RepID=UPI000367D6F9|nr:MULTISPECIES: hypothetical protein [Methylotenera]
MKPKNTDNYEASSDDDFWMQSQDAAMDKAKELGISTYGKTLEDLRYAISLKLKKGV